MIRIATPTPAPESLVAYSGSELDSELRFEPIRHYDPTVGRFINDEPVGYAGDGDLHRYAVNRPQ